MRFCIRKAKISLAWRKEFEKLGTGTSQLVFSAGLQKQNPIIEVEKKRIGFNEYGQSLAEWLTEQYDREHRWETWSITMEIAITVFVALELLADWEKLLQAFQLIFC